MFGDSTAPFWHSPRLVSRQAHCTSCHGRIELQSEGLGGLVRYETYTEYLCPHCHKQNHARMPGQIQSVRAAPDA